MIWFNLVFIVIYVVLLIQQWRLNRLLRSAAWHYLMMGFFFFWIRRMAVMFDLLTVQSHAWLETIPSALGMLSLIAGFHLLLLSLMGVMRQTPKRQYTIIGEWLTRLHDAVVGVLKK